MNTFGNIFKITIFGESHGKYTGVTIDGCPSGITIKESDFTKDIARRKPGKKGTTTRIEADKPEIISGVFNEKSTGTPITILFKNNDVKSKDYSEFLNHPRPSHADFVAGVKYKGFQDYRGSGHFSGRLTLPLVAAGVIAKKIIKDINISARILEINGNKDIDKAIEFAIKQNDSVGGIIECEAKKLPVGLGEPFFDSVESVISHLVFSIPGIKAIEFGVGFSSAKMLGSEYNDLIINEKGETKTNNSGGINAGISNGNNLIFRVAVRPTASIPKPQKTYNFKSGKEENLIIKGRHDVCIALRVPVIIEAVTAIVLADFKLLNNSR
jgi:chorismate synthase